MVNLAVLGSRWFVPATLSLGVFFTSVLLVDSHRGSPTSADHTPSSDSSRNLALAASKTPTPDDLNNLAPLTWSKIASSQGHQLPDGAVAAATNDPDGTTVAEDMSVSTKLYQDEDQLTIVATTTVGTTVNTVESGNTTTSPATVTDGTDATDRTAATDRTVATVTDETATTITDGTVATVTDKTAATIIDGTAATVTDRTAATVTDKTAATVADGTAATIADRTAATVTDIPAVILHGDTEVNDDYQNSQNTTPNSEDGLTLMWEEMSRAGDGPVTVRHPQGSLKYQFYLYSTGTRLIRRWLTLQEIQNIFLEQRLTDTYTDDDSASSAGPDDALLVPHDKTQMVSPETHTMVMKRPAVNVLGVIATIQQVMADEVANSPVTTSQSPDLETHSRVTISPSLLQELSNVAQIQVSPAETKPSPDTYSQSSSLQYIHLDENFLHLNELTGSDYVYGELSDKYTNNRQSSTSKPFYFETFQTTDRDSISSIYEIPGYTSNKLSLEDSNSKTAGPTYTLTPMTTDRTKVNTDRLTVQPTTEKEFPVKISATTNLADYYESNDAFTTSSVSVSDALTTSGNGQFAPFTTYQQVSDINVNPESVRPTTQTPNVVNVKTRQPPESEVSESLNQKEDDTPFYVYNYDYYPDQVELTNVLTPSQMATDAFKENMNFGEHHSKPDEYDYYGQTIYLDEETQDYYEQQSQSSSAHNMTVQEVSSLDFPGPDVAASYHPVEVVDRPPSLPSSSLNTQLPHSSSSPSVSSLPSTSTSSAPNPVLQKQENNVPKPPGLPSGQDILDQLGVSVRPKTNILREAPPGNVGLESTVRDLSPKIREFIDAMNNVTFQVYSRAAREHRSRNFGMSPMNLVSVLSMLLLGSRGATSDALADLLRTDEFRNFNPHLLLKNIKDEIMKNNLNDNIAFATQMFVEKPRRNSIQSLDFFARTLGYFYGSQVEEVDWALLGPHARVAVNTAVSNQTKGAVPAFLAEDASLTLQPPFSVVSSALVQSRWSVPVTEADLFDMSFIRFPSAERRLVRTVAISKHMTLNAGYSAELDTTVAEVPLSVRGGELSMVLVLPGQQKNFVANGLKLLEERLTPARWSGLLRSMIPHTLTLKVPYFRHRSYTDVGALIRGMGLEGLFQEGEADFSGVNGIKSLHLSDVIQLSEFHSCLLPKSVFSFRSEDSFPSSYKLLTSPSETSNPGKYLADDTPHRGDNLMPFESDLDSIKRKRRSISHDRISDSSKGKQKLDFEKSVLSESIFDQLWSFIKSDVSHGKSSTSLPSDYLPDLHIPTTRYPAASEHYKRRSPVATQTQNVPKSSEVFQFVSKQPLDHHKLELKVPLSAQNHLTEHQTSGKSTPESLELLSQSSVAHEAVILDRETLQPINIEDSPLLDTNPRNDRHPESRSNGGPTVAFDRAFMYVIRHNPTGLILYVGRYLDPI